MTIPTRRTLLQGVGLGAAAATVAPFVGGAGAAAAVAPSGPGAAFVPTDADLHLLRRATYGPTPSLLNSVRRTGRNTWLEQQLDPRSVNDSTFQQLLADRFPQLWWSIEDARSNMQTSGWDLMFTLGVATIARAAWSRRQLFEVMCDFWSNHLNVTSPSDNVWDNRHDYDRTVIRRYALGRFEDMLLASAQHPAMLRYLNNADSSRYTLNENYGRELLELHSVGVDAGYTEDDMVNSARIMTGFGVDWQTGLFRYSADDHWRGSVSVMGFSDDNATGRGGYDVGLRYLRYLARHPLTARHIATKLCLRFVSDIPNPTLVSALASTYLANGTDIRPVLRQLFRSKTFRASVGRKVRRPLEDLVATLRIMGIQPDKSGRQGMDELYWMVDDMGQAPLAWTPPNGYPDDAASWQSAGGTLSRWNSHRSLVEGWWPDQLVRPPLRSLVPKPLPATHGALVDALARRLTFRTLAAAHRAAVLSFLAARASTPLRSDSAAVTWRLGELMTVILDSPYHAVR